MVRSWMTLLLRRKSNLTKAKFKMLKINQNPWKRFSQMKSIQQITRRWVTKPPPTMRTRTPSRRQVRLPSKLSMKLPNPSLNQSSSLKNLKNLPQPKTLHQARTNSKPNQPRPCIRLKIQVHLQSIKIATTWAQRASKLIQKSHYIPTYRMRMSRVWLTRQPLTNHQRNKWPWPQANPPATNSQ